MENENNENHSVKASRGLSKKSFKFLLIIMLIFSITPIILMVSLKIVYNENTSDKAFKDHKEEYKQLEDKDK